jgi:hypothetical protein
MEKQANQFQTVRKGILAMLFSMGLHNITKIKEGKAPIDSAPT